MERKLMSAAFILYDPNRFLRWVIFHKYRFLVATTYPRMNRGRRTDRVFYTIMVDTRTDFECFTL